MNLNPDQEKKNGLIFDIERFSTKDGPGIRTVVFFKGCNMNCFWCHNPESIHARPQLQYEVSKCLRCEVCVNACSKNALDLLDDGLKINFSLCDNCFECVNVCYSGALQRIGQEMTVSDVLQEVLEDRVFYQNSGGGVTLSGGEVMQQSDFAAELLKSCKDEGLHTAIDSNMSVKWESYKKVLPFTDLVLADIKNMDDNAHRKAVGISNKIVLENISRVAKLAIPFIVRTPVIPGFNDTKENIQATLKFLKPFPSLLYFELLSYNPLGESKIPKLGLPQKKKINGYSKEKVNELAEEALKSGIKVFVDGFAR